MTGLGTAAVAELARVPVRLAQTFDEAGMVRPERGQGGRRTYDLESALAVMVLAELRERGVGPKKLRRVAAALPADLMDMEFAVFDGRTLRTCGYAETLLSLVKPLVGPLWVVALEDKQRRLRLAVVGDLPPVQ